MRLPPAGVCLLCDRAAPALAERVWTDCLGYGYPVCGVHHTAILRGLEKAGRRRPRDPAKFTRKKWVRPVARAAHTVTEGIG